MFFQLLSTTKVNLVAKMMQSAHFCVIFHVKHKKFTFLAVLSWFLILGKIRDGGEDGDHCWWRHRPPEAPPPIKYTSTCWEDQSLSTEGKIVSKYWLQHIGNSKDGFHQPKPPLYHFGGMNWRVRPRVNFNNFSLNLKIGITWLFPLYSLLPDS